ncbi:GMC oxidoreductase [Gordonia sp. CPCC 205333]|uniref:GMC oxidoreductase n=1 Tax=Gordonia sp. CPCC 205333 TaxID=3140790 RepID=UPI003AF3A07F
MIEVIVTAHCLGGVAISADPDSGVLDPYQRVWGYPILHFADGSADNANLGVNPSLTYARKPNVRGNCGAARVSRSPAPA